MSDTKKSANLIDQATGLSLNPFWINSDTSVELGALKNSYYSSAKDILLHDEALEEELTVGTCCCPHDMNGLLKKHVGGAYIWGENNRLYNGNLYYNDITNEAIPPLEAIVEKNLFTNTEATQLKITNKNYFPIKVPYELSYKNDMITFNESEMESKEFVTNQIKILPDISYKIYFRDFILSKENDFDTKYHIHIRFKGYRNGAWENSYIINKDTNEIFQITWEDSTMSVGNWISKTLTFEKEYEKIKIIQMFEDRVLVPGESVAGGILLPYIVEISGLGIGLEDTIYLDSFNTSENAKTLNFFDYLSPGNALPFTYYTIIEDELFNTLKEAQILNTQSTEHKTLNLLKTAWDGKIESALPIADFGSIGVKVNWTTDFTNTSYHIRVSESLYATDSFVTDRVISALSDKSITVGGAIQDTDFYYFWVSPTNLSIDNTIIFVSEYLKCKIPKSEDFDIALYFKTNYTDSKYFENYTKVPADGFIEIKPEQALPMWYSWQFYYPETLDNRGYFIQVSLKDNSEWSDVTDVKITNSLSEQSGLDVLPMATTKWRRRNTQIYGRSFKAPFPEHYNYYGVANTLTIWIEGTYKDSTIVSTNMKYKIYMPVETARKD